MSANLENSAVVTELEKVNFHSNPQKSQCQRRLKLKKAEHWCFLIVMLEKTPENPSDCKDIKPVNPKRNQPWIFIGRTDAEAETPMLWPPHAKSQLTGKYPNAVKDWRKKGGAWQRIRWLYSTTNSMAINWNRPRELVKDRRAWHAAVHEVAKSRTELGNWATTATKPAQVYSFHILAMLCSKSFKLGFSICESRASRGINWLSKWKTSNCQHLLDHGESRGFPGKTFTFASLTTLKSLTVENT